MQLYSHCLFPLLKLLNPESAHEAGLKTLELLQKSGAGRALLRSIAGPLPVAPVDFCGLRFPNALGIAAGMDKDVRVARALAELGFGHVEVGTLTPRPQDGNPRPRIFRLPADHAIVNRMGFPNGGVQAALPRLRQLCAKPRRWVLGVSLGKQKETPLEQAADDYLTVMNAVYEYADYLAVNVSSPNTPGLRELQGAAYLRGLLERLKRERDRLADASGRRRPFLVKIAPDIEEAELREMVGAFLETGVDGVIATNTTVMRPAQLRGRHRGERGGLSGRPLGERATEVVRAVHRLSAGRLPIVGVGGIRGAAQAREMLNAGAGIVQIYTSMVYGGPGIAGRILRDLDHE